MKHQRLAAALLSAAVMANAVSLSALAAPEEEAFSGYVLMNIPYSAFYSADGGSIGDVDAVSSATNKTGNYGKAGGAYHSGVTAAFDDEGNVSAVGGANGSKVRGVTWAVKADSLEAVKALGGERVTDSSAVTTATAAHGKVSSNTLTGYETLTESAEYSYYVLDSEPANYLTLENGQFKAGKSDAAVSETIDVTASYGTNWGDIQLNAGEAEAASDKIINAIVITSEDGTSKGLYHLDQIWAFNQLAWKVNVTEGLDGKKITGIRYYCSVKDTDLTDGNTPAYVNYVYDYKVDLELSQVFTGEVTAKFRNSAELDLSGLPEDAENLKIKVYYTTGGRNAEYTYITPLAVDPADDDIDPVFVEFDGRKLAIEAGSVTNQAGTTESYGSPVDGTEYTVEISSDNYIFRKINTVYNAAEDDWSDDSEDESSSEDSTEDASSEEDSSTPDADSSEADSQPESSTGDSGSGSGIGNGTGNNGANGQSSNPATGAAAGLGTVMLAAAAVIAVKRKK